MLKGLRFYVGKLNVQCIDKILFILLFEILLIVNCFHLPVTVFIRIEEKSLLEEKF